MLQTCPEPLWVFSLSTRLIFSWRSLWNLNKSPPGSPNGAEALSTQAMHPQNFLWSFSFAFLLPQLHSSATAPWHPTATISFQFLYAERALCGNYSIPVPCCLLCLISAWCRDGCLSLSSSWNGAAIPLLFLQLSVPLCSWIPAQEGCPSGEGVRSTDIPSGVSKGRRMSLGSGAGDPPECWNTEIKNYFFSA